LVVLAHHDFGQRRRRLRRNIAEHLARHGLACCAVELTDGEEFLAGRMMVDTETLADRLRGVVQFLSQLDETQDLPLAIFGEDWCAAAAMMVAADGMRHVKAAGAYCGRPDLARLCLPRVRVPTLLVVPGCDHELLAKNEAVFESLQCASQIAVIGNATPGMCDAGSIQACRCLIRRWCEHHVLPARRRPFAVEKRH
jgi:dienelactone hydrolase